MTKIDLQQLLGQFQGMQSKITELQEKLRNQQVEASVGGGMVVVKANGMQEITAVKIDPEVLKTADVEMLQDLVLAAVNEGLRRAKESMQAEMSQLAGGFPLPPIFS